MIIKGLSYSNKQPLEISFKGGIIDLVSPAQTTESSKTDLIGPGFTDLQVNGYDGLDYNEIAAEPVALAGITRSLFGEGVTSHLATIITNRQTTITRLIEQVVSIRRQEEICRTGIAGIHLEGPFISPHDGPRGAHPKEFVCGPQIKLFQEWQEAAMGSIRMVTVSPEWENMIPFIEFCNKEGVVVSIGHTNASPLQITEAIKAGAKLSTHLGNGMHTVLARHPNYLWSQLADDRLGATIIADGWHLPVEVIRVFQKVKRDKLILISDSVSVAGKAPGDYNLHIGGKVTLSQEGRLHVRENPAILAGAVVSIRQGVSNLIRHSIVSIEEAWEMASIRPEKIIHPQAKTFEAGANGDVVVGRLSENGNLQIIQTIKAGKVVYSF